MKKIAALLLLSIFLFNTIGYFIAFKSVQYQLKNEIKAEIKKKIPSSELIAIVVNKKELSKTEWLEEGKEIYHDGKLYDVVRATENETSITYYCINDKQEESLFANLEEHINTHVAANKPTKSQNQKKIADTIIKLYFSNGQSFKFNVVSFNQHNFFSANLIYKSALIETDSPPPEFV